MDFSQITKEYRYKTELHAHTKPVSTCGQCFPQEVVATYLDAGCDTLTVTNHLTEKHLENRTVAELAEYYLNDYYSACEAAKGTSLNVALGVEIRFSGTVNDYLVYGICPEDIERMIPYVMRDIHTFYREFKNERNIILHAHPFRNGMEQTPIGSVDGIESFNCHPGHNSAIGFACRFAREHREFLVSGGSDYHAEGRHAMCFMRTADKLRDSYDIAEAIKSKNILFDLSGHIVIPYQY